MKTSIISKLFVAGLLVVGTASISTAANKVTVYPEKEVFFGTTHAHSSWSIDAYGVGNQKSGPEDGYRFARGEAVPFLDPGGKKVQLKMPLDFFCMTDHSEMMGTVPMMLEKGSALYDTPRAKLVQAG